MNFVFKFDKFVKPLCEHQMLNLNGAGLCCANLVLTEISASVGLAAAHAHPLAPSVTFHSDYYFTSSVSVLSD